MSVTPKSMYTRGERRPDRGLRGPRGQQEEACSSIKPSTF